MQAVKHGGLSGKARRVRFRDRAARRHDQLLLSEYFEPDPEALSHKRYIPVRGRCEFAPSMVQDHDELMAPPISREAGTQLALSRAADKGPPSPSLTCGERREANTDEQVGERDGAIRFPGAKSSAVPVPGPEVQNNGRSEELTFRGFALGCAMGSAAAAVVLLVLRTAIG